MEEKRSEGPGSPDVSFTANVRASELRFEEVPETEVRFRGNTERETVSGTERENLPDEVQQGVTYRNVGVRVRIASQIVGDDEQDLWQGRKEEQG